MDTELLHQRALRELFPYLIDNVRAVDVQDYIFAGGFLSLDEMEDIDEKGGDRKKTREMLKKLIQKPEAAFNVFLDALRETSTDHVVEEICKKVDSIKLETKGKKHRSGSEKGEGHTFLNYHLKTTLLSVLSL